MNAAKLILIVLSGLALTACGGGGGSSAPASTNAAPPPSSTISQTVSKVTISGKITYDHIPHKSQSLGLNYNAITKQAARGIMVELLDGQDNILKQTITDETGAYSFSIDAKTQVRVQAHARMKNGSRWDVKVTDNTLDNALYVMQGSLKSSGEQSTQTRNLHAASGWDGTDYSKARVAAPFAILSPVYDGIMAVGGIDSKAVFPTLEFRWSPDNITAIGDKAAGHIGTSGYYKNENAIYLLGEAGRDTDEYDPHVIIHEWGHYFEHNLSRLDSMGGLHSLNDKLDPRLAFSEGWGNALAAMITGDPNYKDSSGANQGSGFSINFEKITPSRAGWYNEGSVAAILYDVFDDQDDGHDRISAGFAPIYKSMTHDDMAGSQVFTTIFAFSDVLLKQAEINGSDYEILLSGQSIFSSNALGQGENNSGAIASALPVYKEARPNAGPVEVCSVDDAGNYNKLGNREFVFLNIETTGDYKLTAKLMSGDGDRDPDFNIWQNGSLIDEAAGSNFGEEIYQANLSAGNYVIEAFDFYNINGGANRRGDACFEFSIQSISAG